jgi:rubrerythrin
MLPDPYTPEESVYECYNCGTRITSGSPGRCPDCDSTVRNIAVPRE